MNSKEKKIAFTVNIPLSLVEKFRNAAYWIPGATINGLVMDALRKEIKHLESIHGVFRDRRENMPNDQL